MSLSESENICFTLRSFLVICITPYSNIVFPVQGTFIAILPVHPVPGKENILPICNLRTKSVHYLFQWKNYIHYVHPKAVDLQPFQTSIKSHCHWKKRLQTISLFLSRASITDKHWMRLAARAFVSLLWEKELFHTNWNFTFFLQSPWQPDTPPFGCSPSPLASLGKVF